MKTPVRTISWLLLICLTLIPGLSTAQSSAQSSAQSGSALVRLNDRDDLLGWEAVGRLNLAGKGFCTGTLIAPDLVLTAAHCVFDHRSGALLTAGSVVFHAGLRNGISVAERQVLQIAVPPAYIPSQKVTMDNVRRDVALLRLAAPITSTDADPFVLHSGAIAGRNVSVASYGQGRSEAISRQRTCHVLAASDDLMIFDCDVTFGSSGAPVFARSGNRGRIVSVISGMAQVNGQKVALGMSLPSVVAALKAQMRRTAVAAPDRAIRRIRVGTGSGGNATGAKFVKP